MGEFSWERATLGRELIVWETHPEGHYSIVLLSATGEWTVSLQHRGHPLRTITGLHTFSDARCAVTSLQFQLAVGAIETPPNNQTSGQPSL